MTEIAALQDGEFLNSAVTIPCCGMIFGIAREEAWERGRFASAHPPLPPIRRRQFQMIHNSVAKNRIQKLRNQPYIIQIQLIDTQNNTLEKRKNVMFYLCRTCKK